MSVVPLPQEFAQSGLLAGQGISSDDGRLLVAALFDELLNCALLTAASASIANAIVDQRGACSPRVMMGFLPPVPCLFPQVRLALSTSRDAVVAARAADYYDRLQSLRTLLAASVAETERSGQALGISAKLLAEAWRQLACDALAAVEALAGRLLAEHRQARAERHQTVVGLLLRARAGDCPCVDAHGSVSLPLWADRRTTGRGPRNVQAYFSIGDSLQRAAVLDADERGLGVLGLNAVAVGERVALLLRPGLSIAGRIVWVEGARAGIELDSAMPPDSDLLSHLH